MTVAGLSQGEDVRGQLLQVAALVQLHLRDPHRQTSLVKDYATPD